MDFSLKDGGKVTISPAAPEDAEGVVSLIRAADKETPFLAREPGEFQVTAEEERGLITKMRESEDGAWFTAKREGELVGLCSVSRVSPLRRFRHRAAVSFVLRAAYCSLGIGGKMMRVCLDWCRGHEILQVELEVAAGNERALRMYRGFGFTPVGTMPRAMRYADGSYGETLWMVKPLFP